MRKAKTIKNLIPFLSAVISVVFAFIMGYTYAYSIMEFNYSTNVKSTQAYMGNQQYVVVNDTKQNPILYNPGSIATNISLQYAIDYSFDLRVRYSIDWLGDGEGEENQLPTTNVELIFANRDNVIVDEEYIYFINYDKEHNVPTGLPAGTNEISLISGVEIVDTNNKDYLYKTLKIDITEVLIYKEGVTYDENHPLYKNLTHEIVTKNAIDKNIEGGKETVYRESAKAWLKHKQSVSSGMQDAYIMVYNYRYNTAMGVSAPGHNSTYSKSTTAGSSIITASWNGGNRAYAGVGLYIITGSKKLSLKTKVSGTWRKASESSIQQYDNSIRFNYASGWVGNTYDSNNLFEIKDYEYIIPAHTACYVDIVDSVEITTAGEFDVADLDTYRLVVSEIEINNAASSTFSYTGKEYDAKITSGVLACPAIDENDKRTDYSQENVTLVNSSKYANNIFEFVYNNAKTQRYYNDKMLLINNTAEKRVVTVDYDLNFYISNGARTLNKDITVNGGTVKVRAESFTDTAYYRDDKSILSEVASGKTIGYTLPGTNNKQTYILPAYSSVAILSNYSVDSNFQTYIATTYNGGYDAWVEIDADISQEVSNKVSSNLLVEMSVDGGAGVISVKNVSNEIVTAIDATISLNKLTHSVNSEVSVTVPDDWQAVFWKYYYKNNDGSYGQNESLTWKSNTLYYSSYFKTEVELTEIGTSNSGKQFVCSGKEVNLKPNESINLLSFVFPTKLADTEIETTFMLNAEVTASSADLLSATEGDPAELKYPAYYVVAGVEDCYIVNNTDSACLIRYTESAKGETLSNVIQEGEYFYYAMVVRPGQILKTSSTISSIEVLELPSDYSVDYQVEAGWGSATTNDDGGVTYSEIVQAINNIFS